MIIRILEDGQYEVPEASIAELEQLDSELDRSIRDGDEARFSAALQALVDRVHGSSARLGAETLVPSDLTLPAPGSTLDEVRRLLADEPEER